MKLDFSKLFSVEVIQAVLTAAEVAVEKASPDYTKAHMIAETMARLSGGPVISTPNAKAAEPVMQAVVEAGESVIPAIVGAGAL